MSLRFEPQGDFGLTASIWALGTGSDAKTTYRYIAGFKAKSKEGRKTKYLQFGALCTAKEDKVLAISYPTHEGFISQLSRHRDTHCAKWNWQLIFVVVANLSEVSTANCAK